MTLNSSSLPRSASRFFTGLMSTSEPGRKARTPTSTVRPPLMRSITRPLMILPSLKLFSTSVQTRIRSAFCLESRMWPSTVLGLLEQHVDVVADLHVDLALGVA